MEQNREITRVQRAGGVFALLLTALIWGFAFSAQRQSVASVPPQVFLALRSFLGGIALLPVIFVLDLSERRKPSFWGKAESAAERKLLLFAGISCGTVMGIASLLQQWGLVFSSAGKGGFLTALYIVFVPVIGLFFKKKTSPVLWLAVLLVLFGSYLLCSGTGTDLSLSKGDILLLLNALGFSGHILVIDHFAPKTDCVRMSCIQFFAAGILAVLISLTAGDTWDLNAIRAVLLPLLYCGICSSGIAFTLQIIGQKYVHPVVASLLMSLESVFSVIGGWLVLGETLTLKEITGCIIIFAAIVTVQIPVPRRAKRNSLQQRY